MHNVKLCFLKQEEEIKLLFQKLNQTRWGSSYLLPRTAPVIFEYNNK
jgi:hypothetical protein